MLKKFTLVRFFVTATAIVAAVYFAITYHTSKSLIGKLAPNFNLQNRSGQEVTLKEFSGKYVLVHFWSPSCGTCQVDMPIFNRMAIQYENNPELVILGLSLDEKGGGGNWRAVEKFEKITPLVFTILMDTKGVVADQYGTYALPETFLVAPDGRVLRKWAGRKDWDSESMHEELESIMKMPLIPSR